MKKENKQIMTIEAIKDKIHQALNELYEKDKFLIDNDLCERCINHRFAFYLEQQGFDGYSVDCEYNKSSYGRIKAVSNINGNYIDIVITKRKKFNGDLVCIEIKRYTNYNDRKKDRENLIILTGGKLNAYMDAFFNYKCGFYIIFGKKREDVVIEIYSKGKEIERIDNKK